MSRLIPRLKTRLATDFYTPTVYICCQTIRCYTGKKSVQLNVCIWSTALFTGLATFISICRNNWQGCCRDIFSFHYLLRFCGKNQHYPCKNLISFSFFCRVRLLRCAETSCLSIFIYYLIIYSS